MEEDVQPIEDISQQEGMPKIYKWLIIGIIFAVVLVAGLIFMKLTLKSSTELKDYKEDFNGFLANAKSCEPSKVLYNVSGFMSDTWVYELKLKGIENDSCLFYMEIINHTSNLPQESFPPMELFKSLNKTCNIPLDKIEEEFEYWKAGSPKAFSNKSYCIYAEQVTMTTGGQGTDDTNGQINGAVCTENWNCSSWSACANNQQTRTCTDSNNCGTTTNKPLLIQTCSINTATCFDSDNGKDYSVKGRIKGPSWFDNQLLDIFDECVGQNGLDEYYCQDEKVYVEEYTCPNGCSDGACLQTARACKVMVNSVCQEYYLPDYRGCTVKTDCTQSCQNCSGGTQNCLDFGKWSGSSFDYSNYNHYYKCAECFGMSDSTSCKSGYKCSFDKCVPTLETECSLAVCENCLSGKRKYSSSGGVSICYDCDTNADCKSGFNCTMAECVAL